jgi:hypothetical protein
MTKNISGYIGNNHRWAEFSEKLRLRGVGYRYLWEARTNPKFPWPNVHCVSFVGDGFQPGVLVAILVDYNAGHGGEQNGFGLFFDDSNDMQVDVDRIAGPNAPAV